MAGGCYCKHCTSSAVQKRLVDNPERLAHLRRIAKIGGQHSRLSGYKPEAVRSPEWKRLYQRLKNAKRRCEAVNDKRYSYYGGRGIEFCFNSIVDATDWVVENLGYPEDGETLDRIDNMGNYEPGNLRWATMAEQNRNKREYTGHVYGKRIKRLLELRPDYTYEGIRRFIKLGWTDNEIINHKKGSHVRH